MAKNQTRRTFFLSAPLAAAAGLSLTEQMLFASPASAAALQTGAVAPEPVQSFTTDSIADLVKTLQPTSASKTLTGTKETPFSIAVGAETKKSAKEFEYHEHRDHIFQVLDGSTQYDLGGTPQTPHSTGPGEWLAPNSAGSKSYTLHKGDMIVIPRGTPHKRTTTDSVSFTLISVQTPTHS
jgi:mannose-6-phosphate isomerase-like protein (cupin superfamily)